jgi:hypothetical protein
VTTRFHHYYTPYQNIIYDDLFNLFCDVNYIFVIILSPISSSHATYDENGHFVMEYVPFCDQSLQRHEQIVTDKHFSSSVLRYRGSSNGLLSNMCFWHLRPIFEIPFKAHIKGELKLYLRTKNALKRFIL